MDDTGQIIDVAVKVQYPGVDKALRSDFRQGRLLARVMARLTKLNVSGLADELAGRIVEELDYVRERVQTQVAAAFTRRQRAPAGCTLTCTRATSCCSPASAWHAGFRRGRRHARRYTGAVRATRGRSACQGRGDGDQPGPAGRDTCPRCPGRSTADPRATAPHRGHRSRRQFHLLPALAAQADGTSPSRASPRHCAT